MEEKLRLARLSQRLRCEDEGRGRLGHLYKKILTALHRQRKVCNHDALQHSTVYMPCIPLYVVVICHLPCRAMYHMRLLYSAHASCASFGLYCKTKIRVQTDV